MELNISGKNIDVLRHMLSAKQRAQQYLDQGEAYGAFCTFQGELSSHHQTSHLATQSLVLIRKGLHKDLKAVTKWINVTMEPYEKASNGS